MTTKYKAFPSLRLYDQLEVPYILSAFNNVRGPLWTGFCMMLDTMDDYEDPGYYHELCHWLAASERQRSLPDFGLGRQVNSRADTFATRGVWFEKETSRTRRTAGKNPTWGETGSVKRKTAEHQEEVACAALAIYEPMVGICGWNTTMSPDRLNSAADDFSGIEGIGGYCRAKRVEQVWRKVVQPIHPKVKFETVSNYMKRLRDACNEVY